MSARNACLLLNKRKSIRQAANKGVLKYRSPRMITTMSCPHFPDAATCGAAHGGPEEIPTGKPSSAPFGVRCQTRLRSSPVSLRRRYEC